MYRRQSTGEYRPLLGKQATGTIPTTLSQAHVTYHQSRWLTHWGPDKILLKFALRGMINKTSALVQAMACCRTDQWCHNSLDGYDVTLPICHNVENVVILTKIPLHRNLSKWQLPVQSETDFHQNHYISLSALLETLMTPLTHQYFLTGCSKFVLCVCVELLKLCHIQCQ